ncbi:hypothetical protein [Capnocytophaga sp. H2931]|uniref:hypothetical protein n=1 Tax=Capnocytophaga sp. H2931 TaxID=1945657 RepID=UPI0012FF6475|nr:hypothetical protein [Capnocytophaga sp. H2931]
MRILIKIILSVLIVFVTAIILGMIAQGAGKAVAPGTFIAAFVLFYVLRGIWKYKPKKNGNTDLDKTI